MTIVFPPDLSSDTIRRLVANATDDVLFIGDPRTQAASFNPPASTFERMRQVLEDTGAGWVYSDSANLSRIDYQFGSLRDGFDFGPLIALSVAAAREASVDGDYRWGGLYDLRLRISAQRALVRIPEPLYGFEPASGASQFDYVDPRNRDYQIEMEAIVTAHLKRIGAYLEPHFTPFDAAVGQAGFPVEASVVIPVRNRERTIAEAVRSALDQKTDFAFNVLVVDNHSTDRTAEILGAIADSRLVVLTPERRDLGIGGCWNEAVFSPRCGQFAVQLDSDDLYAADDALARMVAMLRAGPYAMVVGAYSLVDFQLKPIPPGLIDHREWTRDNGRNNALRINGLGAPRAFATSVARAIRFPNVSYGEDYAMALRVSRDFEIARIYDSIYLCRRWEGNTDSALPPETANRYDFYKDWIRTHEIRARQRR